MLSLEHIASPTELDNFDKSIRKALCKPSQILALLIAIILLSFH